MEINYRIETRPDDYDKSRERQIFSYTITAACEVRCMHVTAQGAAFVDQTLDVLEKAIAEIESFASARAPDHEIRASRGALYQTSITGFGDEDDIILEKFPEIR